MKKHIELKKQRELGEILSDTFGFIRDEFKQLLKCVFQNSGIYLLLFLMAMAFYFYSVGDIMDFTNFSSGGSESGVNFLVFFIAALCIIVFGILAYVSANSAVLHYIKSYEKNKGTVNLEDVKSGVKETFMGFIGLGILKWLTLLVAFVLCFFPVLYIMVPMSIVFCIYVFEKKDATESYSHGYNLIKDEFWITFATVIVLGIIVSVAGYVFGLPAAIYSIVKMGVFSGEIDPANMNTFVDPIYILLNILNYLFNFLLNIIFIVGTAFIYFNLNERKNFSGTLERINTIGKPQE